MMPPQRTNVVGGGSRGTHDGAEICTYMETHIHIYIHTCMYSARMYMLTIPPLRNSVFPESTGQKIFVERVGWIGANAYRQVRPVDQWFLLLLD